MCCLFCCGERINTVLYIILSAFLIAFTLRYDFQLISDFDSIKKWQPLATTAGPQSSSTNKSFILESESKSETQDGSSKQNGKYSYLDLNILLVGFKDDPEYIMKRAEILEAYLDDDTKNIMQIICYIHIITHCVWAISCIVTIVGNFTDFWIYSSYLILLWPAVGCIVCLEDIGFAVYSFLKYYSFIKNSSWTDYIEFWNMKGSILGIEVPFVFAKGIIFLFVNLVGITAVFGRYNHMKTRNDIDKLIFDKDIESERKRHRASLTEYDPMPPALPRPNSKPSPDKQRGVAVFPSGPVVKASDHLHASVRTASISNLETWQELRADQLITGQQVEDVSLQQENKQKEAHLYYTFGNNRTSTFGKENGGHDNPAYEHNGDTTYALINKPAQGSPTKSFGSRSISNHESAVPLEPPPDYDEITIDEFRATFEAQPSPRLKRKPSGAFSYLHGN